MKTTNLLLEHSWEFMAKAPNSPNRAPRFVSFLLCGLMLLSAAPLVSAADSDGDGFDDNVDDCPWAYGTSTVDKDGCPDRDGDGTSDDADGWTSNNPNFSQEFHINNVNGYSIDHNQDGSHVAVATNDRVRIYNASTYTIVTTSQDLVDGNNAYVTALDWSPNDMYVAATLSDDTAAVMWASNLTVIHDGITHTGSSRTFSDVAFMPNSTSFAVVDEASGGWGGGTCTGCSIMLVSVADGQIWREVTPAGNSGSYSSVAFSPDGSAMAVGGDGNSYLIETTNWTTVRAMNPQSGANINAIAFSPDGRVIAMCSGYDNGNSRLRAFASSNGASLFNQQATSSCYGADVSPDNQQIAYAIGYYGSDGGSLLVYEYSTNLLVDRIQLARGTSACTQNANQNPCGNINGVSWHPDGVHFGVAVSRNYEGVYFLFADLDPDNDGYNSTDQGDGIVDAFPDDGTQWTDTDGDGFGDNPAPANQPDGCVAVAGTSTEDMFGCPDADGDGWSDTGDWAPNNPDQWVDADGDGHGDNYLYEVNEYQFHVNQSGDAFPNDATQWNDTDGDGYGDNYEDASWDTYRPTEWPGVLLPAANEPDAFPLDRTQHVDTDGDWVGDNPNSDRADLCPNVWGNSSYDRLGCPDSDGDGYSDPDANWPSTPDCFGGDAFPADPTQWCDEDNDGFGSNPEGNNADDCPSSAGTSFIDRIGCADRDGDGYSNAGDPFPDDATQWSDRDGDNRGDNASGTNPDAFPDDTFQWADTDGDGYGDNTNVPSGDDCVEEFGKSYKEGRQGCPDADLDGYADEDDAFPTDFEQWEDADNDGYGDNYFWENITVEDSENPGSFIMLREQRGDAFPDIASQWSDMDGDGWGDNTNSSNRVDSFPLRVSQWLDFDGDGYGDNVTGYQADMCQRVPGTSVTGLEEEWFGCPDADSDGVADDADACPWDPGFFLAADKAKCTITADPNAESEGGDTSSFLSGENSTLVWMGGVIIFMLALIIVAQVSRAAGKRKAMMANQEKQLAQASIGEEEERRQAWIQHYIAEGNYAEARALGWEGTEGLPEWKQHEMQQQAAAEAAIPNMLDLENL